jgi:hypothetical protein
MPPMGDAGPDVWTDELQRTGQVVFPQRRRRAAIMLAIMLLFALNLVLSDARRALDQDEAGWRLLGVFLCAISVVVVAGSLWPVITLRPVLTVDQRGIRRGRRELAWDQVGAVGEITGWQVLRSLAVVPQDVWAKSLSVSQDNVKDLEVFAGWLSEVLEQRRQSDVQS